MAVPMHEEYLTKASEMPWLPIIPGIRFKLLRVSPETGMWSVLFQTDKDAFFPAHKHYGAGEYYVIKGEMHYRAGVAKTGDYGYEPIGVIHEMTTFVEPTELLFTNHGPVIFLNEDGSLGEVLDYATISSLAEQGGAQA